MVFLKMLAPAARCHKCFINGFINGSKYDTLQYILPRIYANSRYQGTRKPSLTLSPSHISDLISHGIALHTTSHPSLPCCFHSDYHLQASLVISPFLHLSQRSIHGNLFRAMAVYPSTCLAF